MIHVHVLESPLPPFTGRESYAEEHTAGLTCEALLERYRPLAWAQDAPVDVVVNSEHLPVGDARRQLELDDESHVAIMPALQGAGIPFIGQLVIMAILAALSYIVTAIVNMGAKPTELGDDSSPTYTVDGITTVFGPGSPYTVVYGEVRVGGVVFMSSLEASNTRPLDRLKVLRFLSEGPIHQVGGIDLGDCGERNDLHARTGGFGLPEGLRINGNLVDNDTSLTVHLRAGHDDQGRISGFEDQATNYLVSRQLSFNEPVIYDTIGSDVERVEFNIRFPGGLYRIQSGQYTAYSIGVEVLYREGGAGVWHTYGSINVGANQPPARGTRTYPIQIKMAKKAQWQYSLRRLTKDDDAYPNVSEQRVSTSMLHSVNEVRDADYAYPNCALEAIEVDGSERLSGQIRQITSMVKGRLLRRWDKVGQVFTAEEYVDTATSKETGRNPAWVLLDLLTNTRYGGGKWGITDSRLDLDSFADWAAYCDELVDDGESGTHPRHRCDFAFDKQRPLWDAVMLVCSAGRATPVPTGSKLKIVFDAPRSRVMLFPASAIREFSIAYLDVRMRPTVVVIQFLNAARDYEQDRVPVDDTEAGLNPTDLARLPRREEERAFFQITRAAHARREGIYIHKKRRLVRTKVRFKAPLVALGAEVGDRVAVQHDVPRWFAAAATPPAYTDSDTFGFRMERDVTATAEVYLDRPIDVTIAETYHFLVQQDDDTLVNVSHTAASTTTIPAGTAITVSAAITTKAGNLVAFGVADKVVKDYVLTRVDIDDKLDCTLEAIEYNEEIYTLPADNPLGDGEPTLPDLRPFESQSTIASVGSITGGMA